MFCQIEMLDISREGLTSFRRKARFMKTAAKKYDVKIHYHFVNRQEKRFFLLAEGDNYQAVESLVMHFDKSMTERPDIHTTDFLNVEIVPVVNASSA